MKTSVAILLYRKACKVNARGEAPLVFRITVAGQRREIWTKVSATADEWSDARKKVLGSSAAAKTANANLTTTKNELADIWADLERQGKPVTASSIVRVYKNNGAVLNLLQMYDAFLKERKALEGIELASATLRAAQCRYNKLQKFLQETKQADLRPEEFTLNMGDKLLRWLLQTQDFERNSALKHLQAISQVLRWGIRREMLSTNPLAHYEFKAAAAKEIVYLEAEEVETLTAARLAVPCLDRVRDCFIFQCWTGLAYADLAALDVAAMAETAPNGLRFLRVRRAKSTVFKGYECVIPLLPEAERLLAKYENVLPVPANQVYNRYLKQVGELCGLPAGKMTTHVGRKTAGTLMLNKGIPIEAVSKFLGHSNVKITQKLYAKLLDTTVLDAFGAVFGGSALPPDTSGARIVPMYAQPATEGRVAV